MRHDPIVERDLLAPSGWPLAIVGLILIAALAWLAYARFDDIPRQWFGASAIIIAVLLMRGFVVLQPNQSVVCILFGSYTGTEHRPGFWWINPFSARRKVSRRLETHECGPLKVNDALGNPIEISAVIVWRVQHAANAVLEVESYAKYVQAQSETAIRRMASAHPYDQTEAADAPGQSGTTHFSIALRDGGDAITQALLEALRERMEPVGIAVIEARISHLAYSPEIAGLMLRKQAAGAVVSARRMVVNGAVSIVGDALKQLEEKNLAAGIDPERKAAMISNLLVVLVGEREVTPVINTGTLYS
ncbi:MAG: SPFH domain-containing protein [Methanobacterium sp.]|nr:SPFH domain-containing protein [Methanobacterium sp.]